MEITVIGDNNQVVNGDYYELVLSPESILLLLQLMIFGLEGAVTKH